MIQALTINLISSGEYLKFQRFIQQLKEGPRLLLKNLIPAEQEPKLKIQMILAVAKRLQIPAKENNL